MIKILFVCHGNICRSPMAEYIFKYLVKKKGLEESFEISSAATSREEIGCDIYPGAKQSLRAHDIPFEKHSARQITKDDLSYFDYIVCMDENNIRNLNRMFKETKATLLLSYIGRDDDVSDPWYTRDFETAFKDISEGCIGLLSVILGEKNG